MRVASGNRATYDQGLDGPNPQAVHRQRNEREEHFNELEGVRVRGGGLTDTTTGVINEFTFELSQNLRDSRSTLQLWLVDEDNMNQPIYQEQLHGIGFRGRYVVAEPGRYGLAIDVNNERAGATMINVDDNEDLRASLLSSVDQLLQQMQEQATKMMAKERKLLQAQTKNDMIMEKLEECDRKLATLTEAALEARHEIGVIRLEVAQNAPLPPSPGHERSNNVPSPVDQEAPSSNFIQPSVRETDRVPLNPMFGDFTDHEVSPDEIAGNAGARHSQAGAQEENSSQPLDVPSPGAWIKREIPDDDDDVLVSPDEGEGNAGAGHSPVRREEANSSPPLDVPSPGTSRKRRFPDDGDILNIKRKKKYGPTTNTLLTTEHGGHSRSMSPPAGPSRRVSTVLPRTPPSSPTGVQSSAERDSPLETLDLPTIRTRLGGPRVPFPNPVDRLRRLQDQRSSRQLPISGQLDVSDQLPVVRLRRLADRSHTRYNLRCRFEKNYNEEKAEKVYERRARRYSLRNRGRPNYKEEDIDEYSDEDIF